MIKAAIAGGAGYTAGELIRLLMQHPAVIMHAVQSSSNAGKPVSAVHSDLYGDTELLFTDQLPDDADVLFLCKGHGQSRQFLEESKPGAGAKIIDLSQDFRHQDNRVLEQRQFVYGLPELNRSAIIQAGNIANPGCFATALQLGLLPLCAAGFRDPVFTTGVTGATGAGQGLSATSHFAWRAGNIQAYKSLEHQHIKEVTETLAAVHPEGKAPVLHFIPWRGDFARGIFVSQQVQTDLSEEQLYVLFETYYRDHPFTVVSRAPIHLKQVLNTNKCLIQVEKKGSVAVIHSAIDNLLKGASGQAVQNMNLMFGLAETTGLKLKPSAF